MISFPFDKKKKLFYWLIMVAFTLGIAVSIIEGSLSIRFFHTHSSYPLALLHYYDKIVERGAHRWTKSIGIWQFDNRFGYSHIPSSRGVHEAPDFRATYTIGSNQERFIPRDAPTVGEILFVGGSYTFGHGVNDDETYPAILATDYWPDWGVQNRAVMGWGTSNAYMVVSDVLDSDNRPSVVLYGMIPHHFQRNYIRETWVDYIALWDKAIPHFELVNGELKFQGVVGTGEGEKVGPETIQKEFGLTSAFLHAMKAKCQKADVPFVVILLENRWPPEFIRFLVESNISFLDLSQLEIPSFPRDSHPNPSGYNRIADAIAKSFISEILTDLKQRGGHIAGQKNVAH